MTEENMKKYHSGITKTWRLMKEFLQRNDYRTNEDAYWQDVISRAGEYMKGENDFTKRLLCMAMDEIARVTKPCLKELEY